MARTLRTSAAATTAGITPVYSTVDNANGENFANNQRKMLHVKNTGGGACTVTIKVPSTVLVDGIAPADHTVVVPITTGDKMIGPFPGLYTQADGTVWIDYSTSTGVTASLIELPATS